MSHSRPARAAGLSLAIATLATAAWAETLTLQGTVAERFGPKLVLETQDGRVLVDGGPDWRGAEAPSPGASLIVSGRETEAGLVAERLLLPDGREIVIAGAGTEVDALDPAAMETLTQRLAEAGIHVPRLVSTTSRHGHFEAAGPEGVLRIRARRDGDLRRAEGPGAAALAPDWTLEEAAAEGIVAVEAVRFTSRHIHLAGPDADGEAQRLRLRRDAEGRVDRAPPPDPDALRGRVEAAGYVWRGDLALHRAHAEVDALNPEGEPVRLRLDLAGEILRERARR